METKLMPQNLEAERAVLGAILLDDKSIAVASEYLTPEHFYQEPHRIIFKRMLDLHLEGKAIDPIVLLSELRRRGELEKIGGPVYLAGLTDGLPRSVNVLHYAELVAETSTLRRLIRLSDETQTRCYQAEERASTILERHESEIFRLSTSGARGRFESTEKLVAETYAEIEETAARKSTVVGLPTGLTELDRMTTGLYPGDLNIVAARPGLGKTSLVLNIACHLGIRCGKRVAIFSLEMNKRQLVKRMIAAEAEVDAGSIRTGYIAKEQWPKIVQACGLISQAAIHIDDSATLTLAAMQAKAERLALEYGIDLIIVDYLQLISGVGRRDQNRTQEVTEISRGLKAMAKSLDVPIVACSQLNRAPEKRSGKHSRPQLSDLRESGAIEQDADLVLFIWRDLEGDGTAEIIVGKQRNGPTGTINVGFIKQLTKFVNLSRDEPENWQDRL